MTEEELTIKIGELGEAIKVAKAEKKPAEEWKPMLDEMMAVKVRNILLLMTEEYYPTCETAPNNELFLTSQDTIPLFCFYFPTPPKFCTDLLYLVVSFSFSYRLNSRSSLERTLGLRRNKRK